jgi:hypothetical protein
VSLGSLPLFTGKFNTCGVTSISLPLGFGSIFVSSANCPVAPSGAFLVNVSVALTSNILSGAFDVILLAIDQADNMAYCAELDFTL